MTGVLQPVDGSGGGSITRCARCSAEAVGPCASCHAPVCGDCCVLTEGGARVWAICLGCEARRGRSLRRAWLRFLLWLALPLAALAFIVALLEWLSLRAG